MIDGAVDRVLGRLADGQVVERRDLGVHPVALREAGQRDAEGRQLVVGAQAAEVLERDEVDELDVTGLDCRGARLGIVQVLEGEACRAWPGRPFP